MKSLKCPACRGILTVVSKTEQFTCVGCQIALSSQHVAQAEMLKIVVAELRPSPERPDKRVSPDRVTGWRRSTGKSGSCRE